MTVIRKKRKTATRKNDLKGGRALVQCIFSNGRLRACESIRDSMEVYCTLYCSDHIVAMCSPPPWISAGAGDLGMASAQ